MLPAAPPSSRSLSLQAANTSPAVAELSTEQAPGPSPPQPEYLELGNVGSWRGWSPFYSSTTAEAPQRPSLQAKYHPESESAGAGVWPAAEALAEVPPHQSQQEDTVTRPGVFSQKSVT